MNEDSPAQSIAAALAPFDTPSVANAIETFGVRLRNEGYIDREIYCRIPHLPPAVGYAYTLRVRSAFPPQLGELSFVDRTDWWEDLEKIPRPRVLVIEDMDVPPGAGAFVGGLHAEILHTLGCVAVVTNGAVRDLPQAAALGFQLFAGSISVSHGYAHVVSHGERVKLQGLDIHPGDLLHGDQHGVLTVPGKIAAQIPARALRMRADEREIVQFCRSEHFSLAQLREHLQRPRPHR